ncbi:hypothetical protein I7I50_09103 [Histoplasma capsulatum G186AR]|uniref:Uncharacterized protein n=1 Tax=Ajellomyces capsulatus TaxID=5037 RepID=A0A8H7YR10_AJECA|nr:hypothetical protein I7I52_06622 [Histoplasma capsulatum]QSS74073.1 hypothetical protein I7I50_09103 [Histoplasma capsulatum G186AR]
MSTGASIHQPILQVVSGNLNGKLIFPNICPECSFFLFFSFCGLGALRSWVLWGGYELSREVENSKRKVKDEKQQQETKGGLEKERPKSVLRLWTSTRKYFPTRRYCFWLRYTLYTYLWTGSLVSARALSATPETKNLSYAISQPTPMDLVSCR